ncbi:hypothetical protein [Actinophytocola algeriensis]|uniref:Integral membrane protein n=1 Tax=Actinophytocola algeriensis TaxID=1768010 RepID=A0A7W7Q3T2_9PSEU|nr:hypothetical protein [Actinophytocola algeriensis]MBB4906303.1 hypothetical protein [Actinophytocola algeriensis]MBE1477784.1 hypothetical protein [Actinophytocola algeriensis]
MRTTFGTILVLLGCLLAAPAVAAYALVGEVTDQQRYLDAVEPLADDPAIQQSVASQIDAALGDKVPASAKPLVDQSVDTFVKSAEFRQLWLSVNKEAHPEVLAMLRGEESGSLSVQGDAIVLDLGDVTTQLRDRMTTEGVPFAAQIPQINANVELISRPAVRQLVPAFDLLETLSVILPIVALALLLGGVLIAARKGRVLIVGGIGLVVMMLLLVLAAFLARSQVTARSPRPELAGSFYDALTSQVLTIAWIVCAVGGVAVIVGGIAAAASSKRQAPPPPPRRRAHFSH